MTYPLPRDNEKEKQRWFKGGQNWRREMRRPDQRAQASARVSLLPAGVDGMEMDWMGVIADHLVNMRRWLIIQSA